MYHLTNLITLFNHLISTLDHDTEIGYKDFEVS